MRKIFDVFCAVSLLALLPIHAMAATATSGSMSATPNPCVASQGSLCTTTINWTSNGLAEVFVQMDGKAPQLMSCMGAGNSSAQPSWIQPGHSYVFNLYGATSCTASGATGSALASVTVQGVLAQTISNALLGVIVADEAANSQNLGMLAQQESILGTNAPQSTLIGAQTGVVVLLQNLIASEDKVLVDYQSLGNAELIQAQEQLNTTLLALQQQDVQLLVDLRAGSKTVESAAARAALQTELNAMVSLSTKASAWANLQLPAGPSPQIGQQINYFTAIIQSTNVFSVLQ